MSDGLLVFSPPQSGDGGDKIKKRKKKYGQVPLGMKLSDLRICMFYTTTSVCLSGLGIDY